MDVVDSYSSVLAYKKLTWLRPYVAPRDARLGDAADMKIKIAPKSKRPIVRKQKFEDCVMLTKG